MNSASLDDSDSAAANSPFDHNAGGDLLNDIEEKRVVPINEAELLKVENVSGPRPMSERIAHTIARLDEKFAGLSFPLILNDAAAEQLPAEILTEDDAMAFFTVENFKKFAVMDRATKRRIADFTQLSANETRVVDFETRFFPTTFSNSEVRIYPFPTAEVVAPNAVNLVEGGSNESRE